jgi:streptogramin lyase
MCTADRNFKIVRYQGQRATQEIDKDELGKSIYQRGYKAVFVTENNNGDVVVYDLNASAVVVVDQTGKVRFRYDKQPGGQQPFAPRHIVIDSKGHIMVIDKLDNCLHILDKNGRFLRCVDSGLYDPRGLSVDSEGRLWVGQIESGEVKVIQYMK